MIRKYHNHKPQTNPWYCEEEPHNHQETRTSLVSLTTKMVPVLVSPKLLLNIAPVAGLIKRDARHTLKLLILVLSYHCGQLIRF